MTTQISGDTGVDRMSYLPAGTGAVPTDVQTKLRESVSVKDFGAVGDGVADDTLGLQAALNTNKLAEIPPGKYRITAPLVVDPILNRNCGFIGATNPSRYPSTQQAGGPTWDGTKESVIFYDGPSYPSVTTTAATSVSQIVGIQGFVVATGLAFVVGQPVTAYVTASPADNRMYGTVNAYNSGTGDLDINVVALTGTGTYAGWTIIAEDNHAVISVSAEALGVEPAAAFANTIWGFSLEGVTLDANNKAGYGLYGARVQDLQIHHCAARGATVAGVSIDGTYSGNIESLHCYLNPGRGFELGAADDRWGWVAQDKVNAFYIRNLHCDANGSSSDFRESNPVLMKQNCGVFYAPHSGNIITGIVSENSFGANYIYEPTGSGNVMQGVYGELGCLYAPGGVGTDAVSLGYTTTAWGLIFVGSLGGTHNAIRDGVIATNGIWITGAEPSTGRPEGGFEINNIGTATAGLKADWANYRLVNSALELDTIVGTQPSGDFTINGGLDLKGNAILTGDVSLSGTASIATGIKLAGNTDVLAVYDEGIWTPAFAGITTPGTWPTPTLAVGDYTRIGRHVFFTGRITLNGVSVDATGQIAITGLPFTVRNANNANASVQLSAAINLATAVVSLDGNVSINNTRFTLQKRTAAATSASSVVLADLGATTSITFSGHYVAA